MRSCSSLHQAMRLLRASTVCEIGIHDAVRVSTRAKSWLELVVPDERRALEPVIEALRTPA